jgi:hypothetical protein
MRSAASGGVGPAHRPGSLVVVADVFQDPALQIGGRGEDAAREHVALDLGLGGHPKPAINRHLKTGN